MSLLQEIEQHGLADCEFNRNLLPDEITFSLHFTDIQEIDESLTNDEAKQVLQLIKRKGEAFDSESIDAWIDYFKSV